MREQLGTAGALGGSLSPRCGSGIGFLIPGTYVPGFLLSHSLWELFNGRPASPE